MAQLLSTRYQPLVSISESLGALGKTNNSGRFDVLRTNQIDRYVVESGVELPPRRGGGLADVPRSRLVTDIVREAAPLD